MRFIALLLLLAVFAVAACSSGEISEVVLTDSEKGSLRLSELTESELTDSGLEEHPGYVNPEKFPEIFDSTPIPTPKSFYLAFYQEEEPAWYPRGVTIFTLVFNSEDRDDAMEKISSEASLEGNVLLLHKGNTFVAIESAGSGSYPASDIADKLSSRLGMEIADI